MKKKTILFIAGIISSVSILSFIKRKKKKDIKNIEENSLKKIDSTNNILVVGLVRDHNKNNVKFDDYKILNDFEICDI